MASSSDSFSFGELNAVMFMINVGSPWSEAEPGTTFADWWEQQFRNKAPILEMGNSGQQLEWVIGMSNRAGVNGLMKPLTGLSEAARLHVSGRQPSGGSTVKVVLRPVRASLDCSIVVQESVGDKLWMVFPATGLHFKTVSRDDLMRSHPSSMLEVFPHCAEELDILDKFLCLQLQSLACQLRVKALAQLLLRIRSASATGHTLDRTGWGRPGGFC